MYLCMKRLRWGRILHCEVVLLEKIFELSGLMHWEIGHSFGKTEQLKDSLPRMMSQPPTNSPSMYRCGIVAMEVGVSRQWVRNMGKLYSRMLKGICRLAGAR
jgi:hypothetical protein